MKDDGREETGDRRQKRRQEEGDKGDKGDSRQATDIFLLTPDFLFLDTAYYKW
jgi:hypothetical protein